MKSSSVFVEFVIEYNKKTVDPKVLTNSNPKINVSYNH